MDQVWFNLLSKKLFLLGFYQSMDSLVWISGGSSLVQSFIKETLPSWFLSVHGLRQEGGESGGMVAMLGIMR